jgi:hypothetical protein
MSDFEKFGLTETFEPSHESQYTFSYNFSGSLDPKEETCINVYKSVKSEELVDLAQAFYEFLLEAGFPAVERVTISTTEETVGSQNTGVETDGSSGT